MRQRNRICKTEEINVLYKYCPEQYTGELAHQRHSRRDVSIVRGKIETPRVDHFYGHFSTTTRQGICALALGSLVV